MPKPEREDEVVLGAGSEKIPLYVTPAVADALELAVEFLQDNPRWYRAVHMALARYQPDARGGALTDLLAALVQD